MGKTGETKVRIIGLLKEGAHTPTQIYKELGLAPSTVSQHLRELQRIGTIESRYDEHFKNVKYYSISERIVAAMRVGIGR